MRQERLQERSEFFIFWDSSGMIWKGVSGNRSRLKGSAQGCAQLTCEVSSSFGAQETTNAHRLALASQLDE